MKLFIKAIKIEEGWVSNFSATLYTVNIHLILCKQWFMVVKKHYIFAKIDRVLTQLLNQTF